MFLAKKYHPKCLEEVIGHDSVILEIKNWYKKWKKGQALLLFGPPGIGKTAVATAFAKERKLEIFELNASDVRTSDKIKRMLKTAAKQKSLFAKGRMILIDEVDALSRDDRGFTSDLNEIINSSKFPVIMTAINAYDRRIKSVRSRCKIVKMKRLTSTSILRRLREVSKEEGLDISPIILKNIADNSQGDLRSALIDLETVTCGRKVIKDIKELGYREREVGIFDVMTAVFKGSDIREAVRSISYCDKDVDEVFWWIEENIANEYEDPREVAAAFDMLSKADMFREKVFVNQNYRFKIHMRNMVAAVALAKKKKYNKFTSYKYPSRIMSLGRSKKQRQELDKLAKELGKKLHCSKKSVKNQMPYLKMIIGK